MNTKAIMIEKIPFIAEVKEPVSFPFKYPLKEYLWIINKKDWLKILKTRASKSINANLGKLSRKSNICNFFII